MSQEKPIIKLENLVKEFDSKGSKVVALQDINLEINTGDIFGIIGLSGAGKSTLVRCINLLEKPTSGNVYLEDVNLAHMSSTELRKVRQSIGMIFQQFNLLMQRTALQNICFPLEIAGVPKKDAVKRAKELLNIVGLPDKENAYPAQLSGGQKQRVAIARALATNPKVLLCDEATSALDPQTTRSILELLKDINDKFKITIIIITHEMEVIKEVCNHVAIIDDSRIVEQGKVEAVFANPQSTIGQEIINNAGTNKLSIELPQDSQKREALLEFLQKEEISYKGGIANV
jgi:D-methionine transport system ATP-binding protein